MKWDSGISSGIGAGLTILVTTLITNWLKRSAKHDPIQDSGKTILVYGLPIKVISVISCVIFIGVLIGASFASPKDQIAAHLSVVLFAVLSASLSLESFRVRIAFDDRFIYCNSPWRPNRQIPWSNVLKYRFSQSMQWYVVETKDYGNVRAHVYISGIPALLERIDLELKAREVSR